MGVYIRLHVLPDAMASDAWAGFYRQARAFLMSYPAQLVGLRRERIGDADRLVYSCDLEQDPDDPVNRHLHVCGDLESMTTGESFCLFEDIAYYQGHCASASEDLDLWRRVIDGDGAALVFSEKTQGRPYHIPLLAIAALAEGRFPGHAMVSGDINREQCELALRDLLEISGLEAPVPLLCDAERLYATVVGLTPTTDSVDRFFRASLDSETAIGLMRRALPPERLLEWLARRLAEHDGAITLGVIGSIRQWLNATKDIDGVFEAACFRQDGPRLEPLQIASALAASGVTLAPERIEGIECLDRPKAAPHSVHSQFGNAMLDMMGMGARNCRCRLGAQPVIEQFRERFPDAFEICRDEIERQTVDLQQRLEELGCWARQLEAQADGNGEAGDGESFVRRRSGDPLTSTQEEMLIELGEGLKPGWHAWRGGVSERVADGDVATRHQLLIRAAEHRCLALTQDGWAWIDGEQDPEILDLLLLLIASDNNALLYSNLRRALFEHSDLCECLRRQLVSG